MLKKSFSLLITISIIMSTLMFSQSVFAVSADSVSITTSAIKVNYGQKVTLSGTISTAVAGQTISIRRSINSGASYSTLASTTTNDAGQYSYTFTPDKSAIYKAYWSDTGVESSNVRVTLIPKISVRRPSKCWVGQKIKVYGRIYPRIRGRILTLQRVVNHRWKNIKRTRTNKDGNYNFYLNLNQSSTYTFRVVYAGEKLFYKTTSKKFRIKSVWRNPFKISSQYSKYIVVNKHNYKLYYLQYGKVIKSWPCGVGMPGHSTPSGTFKVTAKRFHPTWYNPHAAWSKNMPESISWPSSPLGIRALNLSASGIRIHGTTQPWLLNNSYRAISHGCIRMKNPDVTWLYNRIPVSTKVKIF